MNNLNNNGLSRLRNIAYLYTNIRVSNSNTSNLNKSRAKQIAKMIKFDINSDVYSVENVELLTKHNSRHSLIDPALLKAIRGELGLEKMMNNSTLSNLRYIAERYRTAEGETIDDKANRVVVMINSGENNGGVFTNEAVRMLAKYNNEYNLIDNELLTLIQQKLDGGVSGYQNDFLNTAVRNYNPNVTTGGKKKKSTKKSKKSLKKKSSKKSKKGGAKKKRSSKKSKKSSKKKSSKKSKKGGAKKKTTKKSKKSTKKTIKRRSKKVAKRGGAKKRVAKRTIKRVAKRSVKRVAKRTHKRMAKRTARKH